MSQQQQQQQEQYHGTMSRPFQLPQDSIGEILFLDNPE
jgi:hypothetical protein